METMVKDEMLKQVKHAFLVKVFFVSHFELVSEFPAAYNIKPLPPVLCCASLHESPSVSINLHESP